MCVERSSLMQDKDSILNRANVSGVLPLHDPDIAVVELLTETEEGIELANLCSQTILNYESDLAIFGVRIGPLPAWQEHK